MPPTSPGASRSRPLLGRLGLDRPELVTWAMYDWANSAFLTVVVTAVFPVYYRRVAAKGLDPSAATGCFGIATSIALVLADARERFHYLKVGVSAILSHIGATMARSDVDMIAPPPRA